MERDAAIHPGADLAALGELRTETRRDRETSLVVDRVSILTCEHGAGLAPTRDPWCSAAGFFPTPSLTATTARPGLRGPPRRWSTGPVHLSSPLRTTSCHLDGHHTQSVGVRQGRFASLAPPGTNDRSAQGGRGAFRTSWPRVPIGHGPGRTRCPIASRSQPPAEDQPVTIARRRPRPIDAIAAPAPIAPDVAPPPCPGRRAAARSAMCPRPRAVTPVGRLRRCTFRRIDRVSALPGRARTHGLRGHVPLRRRQAAGAR